MQRRTFLSLAAAAPAGAPPNLTLGAYASPKSFWDSGARLDDYGINALFVHSRSIDDALVRRARAEGARVYAEFAAFNGSAWLARPEGGDAWPIEASGARSPKQTWFLGICPTHEPFLQSRLDELEMLVTTRQLDGVWLDYLHWHAQFEDPQPGLPETCFNASCLERFRRETGVKAATAAEILSRHERQWRDWRCSVVVDFARRCRAVLQRHSPKMLLGNYQCAWRDDEHAGARRRILGLDLDAMAKVFDVMSPMVYHGRSGHSVEWVRRNVAWLCRRVRVPVWPIVQAWSDPKGHKVSSEEFEAVLRAGLSGGSSGVMMFTLGAVAEDAAKMAVLKRVYREARA